MPAAPVSAQKEAPPDRVGAQTGTPAAAQAGQQSTWLPFPTPRDHLAPRCLPVNLVAQLIGTPNACLPQGGAAGLDLPRRNLVLADLDLAPRDLHPGDASLDARTTCNITQARLERPVWFRDGRSVSEAGQASWMSTQATKAAEAPRSRWEGLMIWGCHRAGTLSPAEPRSFSSYTSDLRSPVAVDEIWLNRPLMWRLDQMAYGNVRLHGLALADDGPGLTRALKEPELRAQIDAGAGAEGATPLILAAKWGRLAAMAAILAYPRASASTADAANATPLWHASDAGQLEAVRLLLNARPGRVGLLQPRVNVQVAGSVSTNGVGALHAAVIHGHCAIVQLLVEKGALGSTAYSGEALPLVLMGDLVAAHPQGCGCRAQLRWKAKPV